MHQNGIAMGPGLLSGKINVFNDFVIHTIVDDDTGLNVGVEGPSNAQMRYVDNEDGSIRVSYKPQIAGYYKISVKQRGKHLKGSPFEVPVYDSPQSEPFLPKSSLNDDQNYSEGAFGNPSKVKVSGRGIARGISNVQSEIIVDTKKAGLGRVRWSMDGPGQPQLRHINIVSGLHKLYYKIDKKGIYIARIYFNEQDVPGSPFKIRIMWSIQLLSPLIVIII